MSVSHSLGKLDIDFNTAWRYSRIAISYDDLVNISKGSKVNSKFNQSKLSKKITSAMKFHEDIKKKFGTIYTPDFVVKQTVDLAWKYLPEGVSPLDLTYCDPAAGDGNFLIYLYKKLMGIEDSRFKCPIEKSFHILTKCLYGIEILNDMWRACRLRLITQHYMTVKENNGNIADFIDLEEKINISWGNTILLPEDTWVPDKKVGEGGLLPEDVRSRKYDVVVGNPPYTHLRNLNNYRYVAYPKQRDLAQVFVRWALDHLTNNGVCGYNTTDTWLNVKISDGAKETRKFIDGKISEIDWSSRVRQYSENDGGNIGTIIFIISNNYTSRTFTFNKNSYKYDKTKLFKPGFLSELLYNNKYNFVVARVTKFAPKLFGGRSKNKYGFCTNWWRSILFFQNGSKEWRIAVKRRVVNTIVGNVKLFNTDNWAALLDEKLEGEIKSAIVTKEHGLWLLGFLNTSNINLDQFTRIRTDRGGHVGYELSNNLWPLLQVPNYEYYSTNFPVETINFIDWVEYNMIDKDQFLDGVEAEFNKILMLPTNLGNNNFGAPND